MENKNFIYTGWKVSGIPMLLIHLAALAASIFLIVQGGILLAEAIRTALGGWLLTLGIVCFIIACIGLGGFMLLEPNEARVIVFFGNYRGTFYETGYWWINPFTSTKKISIRARNLNIDPIKVNDKTGNPILIGLVLVWRINRDNIYKAIFEIDSASDASATVAASTTVMKNLVN